VCSSDLALLLKQRLTRGQVQGRERGAKVVIGHLVAVVVVGPVKPDVYFIFTALEDFHVGDVVASAGIWQGCCRRTLRTDAEDAVFEPGAVWVIDERDFRLRVLGEFTVII